MTFGGRNSAFAEFRGGFPRLRPPKRPPNHDKRSEIPLPGRPIAAGRLTLNALRMRADPAERRKKAEPAQLFPRRRRGEQRFCAAAAICIKNICIYMCILSDKQSVLV